MLWKNASRSNIARTEELAPLASAGTVLVGESGVGTPADVRRLAGLVDALLVGSALSGAPDPRSAAAALAAVPVAARRAPSAVAPAQSGAPGAGGTSSPGPAPSSAGAGSSGERAATHPRLPAFFGPYGGQFVPELLIPAS